MTNLRSFGVLVLFTLAGCDEDEPSSPVDAGAETSVRPPHCRGKSTVACEAASGRQEYCVCDNASQCESGACEVGKYCAKVCHWKSIPVALGERCDCNNTCDPSYDCLEACPSGSFCKSVGLESRCVALVGEGGECTAEGQCGPYLHCELSSGKGTCKRYPGVGQPCDARTGDCDVGLFCWDGCKAPRKTGETCRNDYDCASFARCDVECGDPALKCCGPSLLGAACTSRADCAFQGLFCSSVSKTCKKIADRGGACDPADVAEQCPNDPLTYYSSKCDSTTRTCVGGICL